MDNIKLKIVDKMKKKFVHTYYFVGWDDINLGIHISLTMPNIEIHLPFGFIRLGWSYYY
jgi:hypothetical protein